MYFDVSWMRAEARLVVGVFFGKKEEVWVIKNFLISGQEFFPGVVSLIVGRDSGLDGADFLFGDDFGRLEVGMSWFEIDLLLDAFVAHGKNRNLRFVFKLNPNKNLSA